MGESETHAAAESRFGLLLAGLALLAGAMTTVGNSAFAQEAATCAPAVGRVVSLQGNVEVQRTGSGAWVLIRRLDTVICAADRLRTDASSRAMLVVQPETFVRVDQNTTITVNQSTDEIEVEFFACELAQTSNTQTCGAGYFITRFPKKFKVTTPHMNAAVEGTEFMVESSRVATKLTVLEGTVSSESVATRDTQLVTAGQSLQSGAAGPAAIRAVVKPQDAVQWVLRYPPLRDVSAAEEILSAEKCRKEPVSSQSACLTERAEALLGRGQVEEALVGIDQALILDSRNSDASALQAIVQIAKNDGAAALAAANTAVAANPTNARAWLAQSYAQQAAFDLNGALDSATKAQSLQPDSSIMHTRAAELLLSLGSKRGAAAAAQAAVAANPRESSAHAMLGYVELAQIDTAAARREFETAIELDSFAAMPRLGLGLTMIREGDLTAGREQLEIAVALDPSNSLIRSYAGKAYYEENEESRDELAASQFDLAKQLDAQDPTPWFYDAILDESGNKPVMALQNLQASIARNNNRAVYRSRLLVDDDAAGRTASAANIYENLGFEKLAVVESTRALSASPGNYSAHRQLASAYANLPRHDIARVSEELQAQIRQPVSLSYVGPQLSTDNLGISKDSGPARPGTNEFNALFNRNDVRVQFDGVVGGRDTFGDQFVASTLADKFSYTLNQLHYETDGFVENDAAEKDIYGLLVHGQVTAGSSLQLEAKRSDLEVGETFASFDEFAFPVTIGDRSDTLRLSGYHDMETAGNWIWSGVVENRERDVRSFPDGALFTNSDANPFALELQYSGAAGPLEIIAGAGYVQEVERFELQLVDIHSESANAYVYSQWNPSKYPLSVQVGLAGEWLKVRSFSELSPDRDPIDRNQLSPKLGILWSIGPDTTLRAAAFSAVRRPFIRSQTIEPTQVAGFNQFFKGFEQFYGDVNGFVSDRVGAAIDHQFSPTAFGGIEASDREITVPDFALDRDFDWYEKTAHAYVYKTLAPISGKGALANWEMSLSADLEYETIDRPQIVTGAEGIMELDTLRAPLGLRLFNGRGTTLRLATTYVKQDGVFSIAIDFPIVKKEDDAWITDISIEQSLPRRRGAVSIGARNIFDNQIDLLEIDPLNPRVATRRIVYGNFKLVF